MKACVRKCTLKRNIEHAIPQVQGDGYHGQNTNGGFWSASPAAPTPQTCHDNVDKLKPGKKYKLKVRADYNAGACIEAKGITHPHTGTP